jgi:hypothetical protein
MPEYKFRLRDDMPPGFRSNARYPELPAAVEFLGQYENKAFRTIVGFKIVLDGFPEYLREKSIPLSSDKALSAGLLFKRAGMEPVFNVITASDENRAGECWFGTFGYEHRITAYFEALREARRKASEKMMNGNK